jgi:uncharacterized protein (TIGR03437 family)
MHLEQNRILSLLLVLVSARGVVSAQNNPCKTTEAVSTLGSATVPQATIVYDPNQGICWLADANLSGNPNIVASLGATGVNPNGSMDYAAAQRWVAALNAFDKGAGYLGHSNWQLPVTALVDHTCADVGTNGGSFGPQCSGSAFGNLYSMGLGETFPASVAPAQAGMVTPLHNLKASYYWAQQNNGGTSGTSNGGQETFSFGNGIQGGTTINDTYYYVLPMVAGVIGTPPSCPAGAAAVVPYISGPAAGNAVYDCKTGYTWVSDANLAASNPFGITGNLTLMYNSGRTISAHKISGGAMLYATATQFIQAINDSRYLGSAAWEMPATSAVLKDLFTDLNLASGDNRLMYPGTLGPFQNLQPFFYWACGRDQSGSSKSPCTGYAPPDGASQLQWSFNFDFGFQSTSSLVQKYFVMVYYPATTASTGPVINTGGVVIHSGSATVVSPGSIVDIYGVNLASLALNAPAGATLPVTLGGAQVLVNGVAAPLFYVGPLQIVFQLPYETALGTASVAVVNNNAASAAAPVTVQQAAPFILTYGDNRAVVINQDGSLNATGNGAKPGDELVAYLVGSGPLDNPIATGAEAPSSPLSREKSLTTATVGGTSAAVPFAGMTPGSVGLVQVNFIVPSLAPGNYPVQITIGGAPSNQPIVTVSQ